MISAKTLRQRWKGEEGRVRAIVLDLRDGRDWTFNLLESKTNNWRELAGIRECPKGQLQGEAAPRDLRGITLSNLNLKGISGLADTSLDHALLQDVSLVKCSLVGTSFKAVRVEGDSFCDNANLEGANLKYAELKDVSFAGANLTGTDLTGANLEGADLRRCTLKRVVYNKESAFGFMRKRNWTRFGGEYQSPRRIGPESDPAITRYIASETNRVIFQESHKGLAALWYLLTNFGRSPGRLLFWVLWVWGGFGLVYAGLPLVHCLQGTIAGKALTALSPQLRDETSDPIVYKSSFGPFYFSAITLTTLGYGDIRPAPDDSVAQVYVSVEAFMGYLFLGGFVSILLQNVSPPD